MTTQALYNKWRSQTFEDILGQDHITQTLRNQIKAERIGHAYLFTGLRGTGKTSTARVLAKAVNCIGDTDDPPCSACHICQTITAGTSLDLIEIDAASNRGIDEIRDLRDRVNFAPSECRYKVYVIDEVHMLTNEAFNALLKTLEEPPPHVIFVLCTTEPHRLPATILSRLQRFDFRRASVSVVMRKLRHICEHEGISIADEALEYIARKAGGSFRDAESLLDQLATYGDDRVSQELAQRILGAVAWGLVSELVSSLVAGDLPTGLRLINEAIDQGADPRQFLGEILDQLRALLLLGVGAEETPDSVGPQAISALSDILEKSSVSLGQVTRAIRLFSDAGQGLRNAVRPQIPFELAYVESALPLDGSGALGSVVRQPTHSAGSQPDASDRAALASVASDARDTSGSEPNKPPKSDPDLTQAPETGPLPPAPGQNMEEAQRPADEQTEVDLGDDASVKSVGVAARPAPEGSPSEGLTLEAVQRNWQVVLLKIKPRNPQVRALLNSVYPVEVDGDRVVLGCEASFHREMLSEDKKRDAVERILSEVLGQTCHIECALRPCVMDGRKVPKPGADSERDLFDGRSQREDLMDELLRHPAVVELKRRGGRVSRVSLQDGTSPGEGSSDAIGSPGKDSGG